MWLRWRARRLRRRRSARPSGRESCTRRRRRWAGGCPSRICSSARRCTPALGTAQAGAASACRGHDGAGNSLAHRTAAAACADLEPASDLDRAAGRAAAAGKLRLAARYFQQAATVSQAGPERDERALSSFELLVRAADVAQAETARPAVELLPVSARRDAAFGPARLARGAAGGRADLAAGGVGRS